MRFLAHLKGTRMSRPTLFDVVDRTREALAARQEARPLARLQSELDSAPPPRGFARALRAASARPAVIAEIKQESPSGGLLRPDFDPEAIARSYQAAGASCLSVLTEEAYFKGNLARLRRVREVVELPLLQKDFLIHPYQVYEARVQGADAILLIAAILDDTHLAGMAALAENLGMDVLLEVHDAEELERAMSVPTAMLGINNRSLKTYEIDLGTTGVLITAMGSRRGDRLLVGESGVRTAEDVARLVAAGAEAVLIGETLMREPDLAAAFHRLFGAAHARSR